MADTAVEITSGTGTNIDTRTESTSGHHRQVVVLGDPVTNAGVAPVDATAGLKVDLGSDNDITGTVTANLSATDNAVLDAIAASVDTLDSVDFATQTTLADIKAKTDNIPALGQALAAASVPVILPSATITTLTPPAAITGFATSAKQDTIIGHVDGIETLLGTIDADTGNIATEVAGLLTDTELRATPVPVSGTVTANLSATDNAVLDAIAASVAGTLTVTGGGGGVEYTEDAAAAADPVGGALIMVRDDALSGQTTTDGDNVAARGTDKGELYVKHVDAIPVTDNGGVLTVDGTVAVTNAGITTIAGAVSGTEMQVDVLTMPTTTVTATDLDVRPLVNTDVVTAELSAVDNAVLDTIAAKDFATQTTLAAMNAKMVTGTDIGDVTINNSTGASAVNIQDGGNVITVDGTVAVTNSDITSIKTAVEVIDNAISGSEMQVDVVASLPAGTNAIGKLAANSGVDIGDVDVTSLPALAAGTNAVGKLIPPDYDVTSHTAKAVKYYTNAGAVTDGIIWSPAAGKRWHVTTLFINVSAAATVTLEDDLAGGDSAVMKMELAANSGVAIPFGELYPLTSGEDAADLLITTTAGNCYVTCVGYEI